MKVPAFSTVGTKNKKIDVQFTGGKLTSDAGVVLLHEIDRKLRLTERINEIIHDPRDPVFTVHQQRDLIAQRIFSIGIGYEADGKCAASKYFPDICEGWPEGVQKARLPTAERTF